MCIHGIKEFNGSMNEPGYIFFYYFGSFSELIYIIFDVLDHCMVQDIDIFELS